MIEKWNKLKLINKNEMKFDGDWLLNEVPIKSGLFKTEKQNEVILTNGLISRTFRLAPNLSTVGFDNLIKGEAIIRGIKPEACISINQKDYDIGGLIGQIEYAYLLPEWIDDFKTDKNSFYIYDFDVNPIKERFSWKNKRYATNNTWPPKGVEVTFWCTHKKLKDIVIGVHYEIYDGIPLLSKWLSVKNQSKNPICIDSFTSEILAITEWESVPQGNAEKTMEQSILHMESDYIFAAMSPRVGNVTTHWEKDLQYTSQVAYTSDSRIQLESKPDIGPDFDLESGKSFETFRTYELLFDSAERERKGLSIRKMYRTIAPWITENPIFMHIITANPDKVMPVIDQCKEVGFEMVILSFGCGINMEWDDEEFYEEFKELFDYAHSKGIEIGTYSLFSSRKIGPETDVIMPNDENIQKSPTFGNAPCMCSEWGIDYVQKLKDFMVNTGADFLEHDGPYPGDVCASTKHPGHKGLYDSQWKQWKMQSDLYKWCCGNGIYINQPDWYFLSGGTRTGMGYKEVNWSLPRERQVIIARQNIYDGTWEKTSSMGWMLTPLSVYHQTGEWKKSTLEPLSKHIKFYDAHLRQNFLTGTQSCYRGNSLYDTEETKEVVKKWVDIYKKHRGILDSDMIHIRRPDGRNIDGIVHVNPKIEEKGLLVLNNPLGRNVKEKLKIPLYYTGLTDIVKVSKEDGEYVEYKMNRDYNIEIEVEIEPENTVWYVIK